jgi:hypothetical protein
MKTDSVFPFRASADRAIGGQASAGPDLMALNWYEIKEFTKEERVAAGDNGNVLRWSANGKDDQLWLIVPAENGDGYHFVNKHFRNYMSVGSDGNILMWDYTGEPAQRFLFQPDSGGAFRLMEMTKDENVAVGGNGNVLRWASTGKDDQKFALIARPIKPALPALPVPVAQPGAIDDRLPKLTEDQLYGRKAVVQSTEPVLVAAEAVPATLVYDFRYKHDRIGQVAAMPYYVITREQYWDMREPYGDRIDHIAKGEDKVTYRYHYGLTKSNFEEASETFNFSVGAKAGGTTKKGIEIEGSATFGYAYNRIRRMYQEEKWEYEKTAERSIRADRRTLAVLYQLIDHYTVTDADGVAVGEWTDGTGDIRRLVIQGEPFANTR